MHALATVNTPIHGWKVYQTHPEYQMLMIEGNLVVTYMMMLLAILVDHCLTGHMMLKVVEIFHYCVLQSEIYKDLISPSVQMTILIQIIYMVLH